MGEAQSPVLDGYPVQEFKVGYGFKGFDEIPVVALDEERLVSRHALSPEEVEEIVRTRELFIVHPHDARRVLPVRVLAARPEYTLPVVRVSLPGGAHLHFHGLEVSDAGGTEPERQDFAAAEAASLIATRARLPAKAALFPIGKQWGGIGGEEFGTSDLLEEGLVKRLKSALARGAMQLEASDAAGKTFRAVVVAMTPAECREAEAVGVPG
jgi:hypothetical protein